MIRLTDRVGKGVRSAPRDAMIADAAEPGERGLAFGFHRAMDHAGAVIGPLFGYAILSFVAADRNAPTAGDYRTLFLLASIPALAAVLVAALFVRETRRERKAEEAGAAPLRFSLRGYDGNFKRFLFILALFTLSNSSDAFLLLRAQESGVSTQAIPLLWAALHIFKVGSSLVGGALSDRLGRRTLIVRVAALRGGLRGLRLVATATGVDSVYHLRLYFGSSRAREGARRGLVRPESAAGDGLYNFAFSIRSCPPRS